MTEPEAKKLTAKLFAAFQFHIGNDQLTAAVYIEQIQRLHDFPLALEAVNDLISNERYLPPVALLNEQYRAVLKRQPKPLELSEAPLTPEQREENIRQAKAVLAMLEERRTARQDPGTGDVPWFDNALKDGALLADELRNGGS